MRYCIVCLLLVIVSFGRVNACLLYTSDIDLAILENGQYNEGWKYIHLMPDYLIRAALDLKAKKVMTVHHSKYALAHHRWDEPLRNEINMAKNDSLHVLIPGIGEVVRLSLIHISIAC